MNRIAVAFSRLLWRSRAEVATFATWDLDTEDWYEWLSGYDGNQFFQSVVSMRLDDDDPFQYDTIGIMFFNDVVECPECNGVGEESFLPAGEQCEHCRGTGVIR